MTRKSRLVAIAAATGLLLLAGLGLYQLMNARCFALGTPAICRGENAQGRVALSFDDGPTELGLNAVLPVLQAHGVKATFFLIGGQAEAHPGLVRQVAAAGHEVANHSYSHDRMVFRSADFYANEIARTQKVLGDAGAEPALFRPPYGKKLLGLPAAVERQGLKMVMWDVEDPSTRDVEEFARQVVDQAQPGSIILLHAMYPSNDTARRALPRILEGLRGKRLAVVSVSELLR